MDRQLELRAPVADALGELYRVQRRSLSAEWPKRGGLLVALLAAAAFVGALFEGGVVWIGIWGATFALALGTYLVFRKRQVEPRKVRAVNELLKSLRPELARKGRVRLQLDFGGFSQTSPVTRTRQKACYVHRWLALSFRLLDGTTVRLDATLHAKRKRKAKRKYTKVTDKAFELVTVRLLPPEGQTFLAQSLGNQPEQLLALDKQWRPWAQAPQVVVEPGEAKFTFRTRQAMLVKGRGHKSVAPGVLVDGLRLLQAVIASYHCLRSPG